MLYLSIILAILSIYLFYRYYYRPKTQIKKCKMALQDLGYKVYEQPFSFMSAGFLIDVQKGKKEHGDAQYFERTVFTEVDVVIGNILDKLLLVLINPDLLKEFYSAENINKYHKLLPLIEGTKIIFGEGMFFSEGETWKTKRKIISNVFNFQLLKENIPKIVESCDQCLERAEQHYSVSEKEFKFDVQKISARMFNRVTLRCFFGCDEIKESVKGEKFEDFIVKVNSEAAELSLSPIMIICGKLAFKLGLTAKIRKIKEEIAIFRQMSEKIIKLREEEVKKSPKVGKCSDIVQALVMEKLSEKTQFAYSDQDLVDEFSTFLVVGTDSSSRFLAMMVYYLGQNPAILQKARNQIDQVINTNEDYTYENLKKLNYIDMIQNETTRHFGPGNGIFIRVAMEDNYLKDIPVSKGTALAIQPRGNHYNPKFFNNPNEFRPERWESQCDTLHPFAFSGFGGGPRTCIGKHLAHLQSKIALIKLIKRYESFEVPSKVNMVLNFVYEPQPFDTKFTKVKSSEK